MFNWRTKYAIRALMLISLIPIFAIANTIFQSFETIEWTRSNYINQAEFVKQHEWDFIKVIVNENAVKAKIQADSTKKIIESELLKEYSSNIDQLRVDLRNAQANIGYKPDMAHTIIYDAIVGKFINVQSDDNRMIIVNESRVIFDPSLVESQKGSREWDSELNSSKNKDLASHAIQKIINKQTSELILTESSYYYMDNKYSSIDVSIDSLKEEFYEHGLLALKKYDGLVPAYITEDGDIFGVPDVDHNGLKNQNDKMIVIQRFNLYDAVQQHKEVFSAYELIDKQNNERLDREVSDIIYRLVLNIASMSLVFVTILFIVATCLKWSDVNGSRRSD